jgi:hypothetical protein
MWCESKGTAYGAIEPQLIEGHKVSNFRINNIPANGFDLSNPQTCSPYVPQIFEGCW